MASSIPTLWHRFRALTWPLFQSPLRWQALGMLGLLLALLFSVSGFNIINSYVGRDFITAVSERRPERFYPLALLYAGVFLASTVIAVVYRFTEERLGLLWRDWLTRELTGRYLAHRAYLNLLSQHDIDNPDQRITEDVRTFTSTTLSLLLILLNSAITLCAFSGILWSITPWLLAAAMAYALLGSLMTILVGRKLVLLNFLQFKKEADLRHELIHLQERAEPIALQRDERKEQARILNRLAEVVDNFKRIIGVNRNLGLFTTAYNYMIQLIPVLIVAPLYVRGRVEFGVVTQSAMAFDHVIKAFSVLMTEFQRISSLAAVISRLGSLLEAMVEEPTLVGGSGIEVLPSKDLVSFEHITLWNLEKRVLIRDLSLEIPRGQRVLLIGPNGVGRSLLLRATAGLWRHGEGRIRRPELDSVIFVPQRPYLVPSSLRELLQPAGATAPLAEQRLRATLRQVRFEEIVERAGGLDQNRDWGNLLSPGEQQVLIFARLLLAQPVFAFLDEATAALEASCRFHLYTLLARTPIGYLSVENDKLLARFHDRILELTPTGTWHLDSVSRSA